MTQNIDVPFIEKGIGFGGEDKLSATDTHRIVLTGVAQEFK